MGQCDGILAHELEAEMKATPRPDPQLSPPYLPLFLSVPCWPDAEDPGEDPEPWGTEEQAEGGA